MENKNELTEKLRVLETEVFNAKLDLNSINSKLEAAYKYEEALVTRQVDAKKKTEELRNEFFKKSNDIREIYDKMKLIMDAYTGNFYTI